MEPSLFQTQREKALEAYKAASASFIAATLPYHSKQVIKFDVVDRAGAPADAFAVARKNQTLEFFSYGKGTSIDLGGTLTTKAGEAETNLVKGNSTNGASDYIIEGVGFSCSGARVLFTTDKAKAQDTVADADVLAASQGNANVMDPGSVWIPPQVQSPFNLEQAMFQALLPLMSLQFTFDDERTFKLGLVDLLPQAGAQSFLRANGVPDSQNRYEIPEGFLWRRDGQSDSELSVTVRLERDLVVPLTAVTFRSDAILPDTIWLEATMRLFGLSIKLPSEN